MVCDEYIEKWETTMNAIDHLNTERHINYGVNVVVCVSYQQKYNFHNLFIFFSFASTRNNAMSVRVQCVCVCVRVNRNPRNQRELRTVCAASVSPFTSNLLIENFYLWVHLSFSSFAWLYKNILVKFIVFHFFSPFQSSSRHLVSCVCALRPKYASVNYYTQVMRDNATWHAFAHDHRMRWMELASHRSTSG